MWELDLEVATQGPEVNFEAGYGAECIKIVRFSVVAAVSFTAPPQNRAMLRPQDAQFAWNQKSLANGDSLWDQNRQNRLPLRKFRAE